MLHPVIAHASERIEEDVREGFISRAQANEDYSVVFADDGEHIDPKATERRRAELISSMAT